LLFSLNPCKIYSFAPKEGGGKWGVCPIRHSACVALIKPPSPGARLPWAMTPCINRVIAACSHAGGVPFSSLSPFLFRYILSCLQSSFSIKNETDRDRTLPRRGRAESAASVPMLLLCPHEQSTWIPSSGPAAPPVGRTSKSRSIAILGQKIALISALALLGRGRCHVLPTPTLLPLSSLGGHLLQADEPVHPCLATQTLGWSPLRLSPPLAA
jgi:hypothetical protein